MAYKESSSHQCNSSKGKWFTISNRLFHFPKHPKLTTINHYHFLSKDSYPTMNRQVKLKSY
uniref:Uncharacterized protein n=1 Tax=Helianthus annuus TaxID=4232 RepID=A0A251VM29_HELAN